jgi:colicin import membrane protein
MKASRDNIGTPMEPKWGRMLALSGLIHVALFSLVFLIPDYSVSSRIKGVVYEVDLVELPKSSPQKTTVRKAASTTTVKKRSAPKAKPVPAKRISRPKPPKKPVVVAKRTLEVKKPKRVKPKVDPTRLIDQAVTRIERKVQRETEKKTEPEPKIDHVNEAIAKLAEKQKEAGPETAGNEAGQRPGAAGIAMRMYQLAVEEWIKSNWSYPVALTNTAKNLETIVVLRVRSDGSIIESRITRNSSDPMFDRSVMRAIERSDPLPQFPEGYRKSQDDVEINFNLKDLERH